MNIKTITCHNVYNYGASLQAYALMKYLQNLGHNVEIIDYMPKYITKTLSLWYIGKRWKKNVIIRTAFYSYVVPMRLLNRIGRKKFDRFTSDYLNLTKRYDDYSSLCADIPEADVYFAGSDQIWNTNIKNGLDPAFYLDFVPSSRIRASYAASFSISEIPIEFQDFVKSMLNKFDYISVREKTGLKILENLGIIVKGMQVVDPVFLLPKSEWEKMIVPSPYKDYILVYDQENSPIIKSVATYLSKKTDKKIVAFQDLYPRFYADYIVRNSGPIDFISLIANADIVITNSFHCTAFSIIFEKNFYVVPRTHQKVNSRMGDLLSLIKQSTHMITCVDDLKTTSSIDYLNVVNPILSSFKEVSYQYINSVLK